MFKKLTAIALLAAMLMTAAACSDSGSNLNDPAQDTTAQAGEQQAETTTAEEGPDLPEKNFDGYEFKSLSRGFHAGSTHWYIFDTEYFEEQAGDVVMDAVLERNTKIEEQYNCKIKILQLSTTYTEVIGIARTAILAGDDMFDIYGESIATSSQLAAEGMMVELTTVPYLNLEADYWDQKAREQLSVGGKLYTMISDFTLMDKHGTWITMFTKKVIEDYKMDDPYRLVRDGKWTLDKMYDMAKVAVHDVDGDGIMTEADSWGTAGEVWNINAFMVGCDVLTFTKNKDDIPEITLDNEHAVNAFEKANKIIGDHNFSIWSNKTKNTYSDFAVDCVAPMMEEGRVPFYVTGMNRVILFRGMDTDFGIIPQPKYDENQDEYKIILTYGNTNSVSVPITNGDLERTGIILEAITYESSKTTYPAYIEKTIKGKHIRDEESIEMLELIFDNRAFDLGIIFNWGSVGSFYTGLTNSTDPNYTSTLDANSVNYVTNMEKTVELFKGN